MQKWPTYGQKCDFQYGGRRHLEFTSGDYFCHLVLFGQRLGMSVKFHNCSAIYTADLLISFLMKSPSWSEVYVKISCQSLYNFQSYSHLKILQIWLKTPIPAPKIYVFVGF